MLSRLAKLSSALHPKVTVTVTTVKAGQKRGELEGGIPQCPHKGAPADPPQSEDGPGHWASRIQATHHEAVLGSGSVRALLRSSELVQMDCVITEHEPEASNTVCVSR